jgi:alpha-ribazole phosphatase
MMNEATVTRWWWLRHAPTPGPNDMVKGKLDLPADTSEVEIFVAQATGLPRGAAAVTSSRMRARQTFDALVRAGLVADEPTIEADFDEQDFGRLQGKTWTELADDPDLLAFWADSANVAPPGGESFARMVVRVSAAIARVGVAYAGRDIIAVAHAGTIRAALALALDLSPAAALRFAVENVSLTRIDAIGPAWRVLGVNATPFP